MLSVGLSADNGMKFGEFPLFCVTIGLNGPVRGILLTKRLRLRSAFAARLLTRANLNSTATCSFPGSFEMVAEGPLGPEASIEAYEAQSRCKHIRLVRDAC
jgi:hypothetical protein